MENQTKIRVHTIEITDPQSKKIMITSLLIVTKITYHTDKEAKTKGLRSRISERVKNKLRQSTSTFEVLSISLDTRNEMI